MARRVSCHKEKAACIHGARRPVARLSKWIPGASVPLDEPMITGFSWAAPNAKIKVPCGSPAIELTLPSPDNVEFESWS